MLRGGGNALLLNSVSKQRFASELKNCLLSSGAAVLQHTGAQSGGVLQPMCGWPCHFCGQFSALSAGICQVESRP